MTEYYAFKELPLNITLSRWRGRKTDVVKVGKKNTKIILKCFKPSSTGLSVSVSPSITSTIPPIIKVSTTLSPSISLISQINKG